MTEVPRLSELLKEAPSNWGRWGSDDQVGTLNHIDAHAVMKAVATVRTGQVLTLGMPIGAEGGDVAWPGRTQPVHRMTVDRASYENGSAQAAPGGLEAADDELTLSLQGTTHTDALGHVWYDGTLYNGHLASTTNGGLEVCSILPIAERGIVGRGVLLDLAASRGVVHLSTGDVVDLPELLACAHAQNVEVRTGDILLLRTGWLTACEGLSSEQIAYRLPEPGLGYTPELVEWIDQTGVAHLVTDTLANEATLHPPTGVALPLHAALLRNLGLSMTEVAWLDDLAAACRARGSWEFLYVAAAIKVRHGTGAPTNPVVVL